MLVKALRNGLGIIIVFVSWLTQPKQVKRSEAEQVKVQALMQGLALYQLYACPFCVKTRRAIHRLNINIDIRDIGKQTSYRQELEQQGGRVKVPCLRIEEQGEVRWMYESGDIISYLDQRIG
jgi:glutaredoxin